MNLKAGSKIFGLGLLASAMMLSVASLSAQDGAKQDMKDAGHDTKNAAKDTGRGVKTGTRKAYHSTKRGTKRAYHKTGRGIKKVGDKMEGHPQ